MSERRSAHDLWGVSLMIFGLTGLTLNAAVAIGSTLIGILSSMSGGEEGSRPFFWLAAAFAAMTILGLPAIYWGGRAVFRRTVATPSRPKPFWIWGVVGFPIALAMGFLTYQHQVFPTALTPLAHFVAAGAPVIIAVSLVRQRGPAISARRAWGHFLVGLWGVPPFALAAELALLLPVGLLILISIAISSGGSEMLRSIISTETMTPDRVEETMQWLITQRWTLLLLFSFPSVAIPLIEEALKSMTIWPLLGRGLTSAEAFIGGALGGAGYALFESLLLPQPGGEWVATMIGRMGTSWIHALATAVTCWGLVQMVQKRAWHRMIAAYLFAVAIHGIWNASAVGIGFAALAYSSSDAFLGKSASMLVAAVALLTLTGLSIASLIALNKVQGRLTLGEGLEPTHGGAIGVSSR